MSKYTRPKRDVQNFNADNFEPELIQTTNDVLKITKNEIQSKMGFYYTPGFNYTDQPISNFISTNNLEQILDDRMRFVSSGSYYIRYLMNLRPRLTENIVLKCANSPYKQTFKTEATIYSQVSWEGLVFFNANEMLEFYFKTIGGNTYVATGSDLHIENSNLFIQLISTQNVLI